MNKIITTMLVVLILLVPSLSNAEICQSSYLGKEFYFASIHDNASASASCEYRYCYYGCIYESYHLSGHYRPSDITKPYWQKTEDGYTCYVGNSRCEFVAR